MEKKNPVAGIITHTNPHFDEIAAIWALKKFGVSLFPGIGKAKVGLWPNGGSPDGKSASHYEKQGYVLIGTGKGLFDEHGKHGKECVLTLVLKHLGLEDEPALRKIAKFALNVDTSASAHPFDLSSIIKCLHNMAPENLEAIMAWVFTALDAKYNEQFQFFNGAKKDFDKKAEIEIVSNGHKNPVKVVFIESDDTKVATYARSVMGCQAAMVVQKGSSGNVQVYTNKKRGLKITDVVKCLRVAEQQKKGRVIVTDWKRLAYEDKLPEVLEWYYHQEGQMLLNGSLSAPDVPPTKIPWDEIKELVLLGIDFSRFHQCCPETGCKKKSCPFYCYGLSRCSKKRYEESR